MTEMLTLPGVLASLYDLMGFVTSYAQRHGFSPERVNKIELAVEEVLVNIINHAYKDCGLNGDIEIVCELVDDARTLVINIVDTGIPFDILSTSEPDTNADLDQHQIGGLGIFLIKQLMDEVRYVRELDRNKLTLISHKNHSSSQPMFQCDMT
jgi:anti-sigma regulatory factor (Ser/Thr protein kinase)